MDKTTLSNAHGMRDFVGRDLALRQFIIKSIRRIFEKMDAVELDTPVIEQRNTVDKLYGEEFDKLCYELVNHKADSECKEILRYDMTVPLARYCAMNALKSLRRYQIGKVYRRDHPNMLQGRYREFYQCDFDIIGDDMGSGINDIEILILMTNVLDSLLKRGTYKIKINHRKFLTDILVSLGIPVEKITTVCSTIDKCDKMSRHDILKELVQKDITESVARNICDIIYADTAAIDIAKKYSDAGTLEYMQRLFKNLSELNMLDVFELDIKLARGMDYYTGIIYEAVYLDSATMPSTIAAGGRYDNMIGKLSNQDNIPAIGLSFGVERIARILEKNFIYKNTPLVYIATIGGTPEIIAARIKLCSELRQAGINTAMSNKTDPKMRTHYDNVFDKNIPYMVIIGKNEIANNQICIKHIATKTQKTYSHDEGIKYLMELA